MFLHNGTYLDGYYCFKVLYAGRFNEAIDKGIRYQIIGTYLNALYKQTGEQKIFLQVYHRLRLTQVY